VTLTTEIAAASAGATLDLTGRTFTENVAIGKSIILLNGTNTAPVAANAFDGGCVSISADDVTIDGMVVNRGARLFHITGSQVELGGTHRDGTTIRNTVSAAGTHKGAMVQFYGPIADTLIELNDWTHGSSAVQQSSISGRVSDNDPCSGFGSQVNNIVRHNVIDQGAPWHSSTGGPGWFGIEIKCGRNWRVHDNELHGGHCHTSWPDGDAIEVDHNDFHMQEHDHPDGDRPWLGVEVAGPDTFDIHIHHNTIVPGAGGPGWMVQGNSMGTVSEYPDRVIVECNDLGASSNGNLIDSIIRNNTTSVGISHPNAGNGNTLTNNDADGADHADCVEGAAVTPGPATLLLTTYAPTVAATENQVLRPVSTVERGDWVLVG
jgi:hypothetical protein